MQLIDLLINMSIQIPVAIDVKYINTTTILGVYNFSCFKDDGVARSFGSE